MAGGEQGVSPWLSLLRAAHLCVERQSSLIGSYPELDFLSVTGRRQANVAEVDRAGRHQVC